MRRAMICVLLCCVGISIMAAPKPKKGIRYSSNPIGPLAVLGIHVSESVAAANRALYTPMWKSTRELIDWPVVIDPSFKRLKDPVGIAFSFGDKSTSEVSYTSDIIGDMAFPEDRDSFIIVLDRAHRVRGFVRSFVIFDRTDQFEREANRLVEDLLLNIDGQEKITYVEEEIKSISMFQMGDTVVLGGDDDDNFDFQTDLKMAMIEEARKKANNNIEICGFFKYLGKPIPNYSLSKPDGSATHLYDLIGDKVTMIVVLVAPEDDRFQSNAGGLMVQFARKLSDNFAKGAALPGKINVPNAHPDAP